MVWPFWGCLSFGEECRSVKNEHIKVEFLLGKRVLYIQTKTYWFIKRKGLSKDPKDIAHLLGSLFCRPWDGLSHATHPVASPRGQATEDIWKWMFWMLYWMHQWNGIPLVAPWLIIPHYRSQLTSIVTAGESEKGRQIPSQRKISSLITWQW